MTNACFWLRSRLEAVIAAEDYFLNKWYPHILIMMYRVKRNNYYNIILCIFFNFSNSADLIVPLCTCIYRLTDIVSYKHSSLDTGDRSRWNWTKRRIRSGRFLRIFTVALKNIFKNCVWSMGNKRTKLPLIKTQLTNKLKLVIHMDRICFNFISNVIHIKTTFITGYFCLFCKRR